ncbi:twin-arginine translocation pathway signal [Gemmatimonas phototrophica]|uniref:Twin-arginine translocation pathway signal n=1 Tax=Gemmatimonas phototrophica TaxID=1379270 RepID=A0A143BIX2_9BACT|nr:twin-arginine translocation pathway signal [Gemmatimonas phototrophica]
MPAFSKAPFVFATAQYDSGDWDSAPLVPANIIDSVARYTSLEVRPQGVMVPLSSEAVFGYPLLYLTGHLPVRFSTRETDVLRRYLDRGGLLFVDDHNHDVDGAFNKTAREEIRRVAGPLVPLPNSHELYRCFFVFENGPPTTSHEMNGWGDNLVHEQLDAVVKNGRIRVLYSNKDYSSEWSFHPDNKRFLSVDNTRFGVNLVVYALTR